MNGHAPTHCLLFTVISIFPAHAAPQVAAEAESDLVRYVRPEVGTVNTGRISTGNVYPLIGRPWGMNSYSPVTNPGEDGRQAWFYDYTHPKFHGVKLTHQLSPWIGDYASLVILPQTGTVAAKRQDRFAWYSHKAEKIAPSAYEVYLGDYDVTFRLAPTSRAAAMEAKFGPTKSPAFVIDPLVGGEVALAGRRVSGITSVSIAAPYDAVRPRHFFVCEFDDEPTSAERLADGALAVRFAPLPQGGTVKARVASSFISAEQALVNLHEVGDGDVERIAREGRAEWNRLLSCVKVESDDLDRLRMFYTCLYRMLLFPKTNWETTADGKTVHWSPADGRVRDGYWYSGTCFWDTFRALYPFINLVYPEMSAKTMGWLVNCQREYGWLPELSSPGLTDCMIGNNVASVVADACFTGVRGAFDYGELLEALIHETENEHPKLQAIGRKGARYYLEKGYVPRDVGVKESAARTLEYAYDDWCVAQLAEALGRKDVAETYSRRAQNWKNVFDPVRKIVVGRNADGTFKRDFNPLAWGGDFTEGNACHYQWSVFQDVPGLMAAMGGAAEFEKRLDGIFTASPAADWSAYGFCIHEIREMQIMGFGQYAHGNQPIQHMIYLYDWTDSPRKAQYWAREVLNRLYHPQPDGYCGDEDNGQTSAWYVWSALGLYPASPASRSYALGAPLFEKSIVRLGNGNKLEIVAEGVSDQRRFVRSRTLNGRPYDGNFLSLADFLRGGKLEVKTEE